MSFLENIKNRLSEVKEKAAAMREEISEERAIAAETAHARLLICTDCDRLFEPTFTCKECGCFMKVKTKLKSAKCPLGKW